jgi:myo-inositol-1(or 4)-monophosphatase
VPTPLHVTDLFGFVGRQGQLLLQTRSFGVREKSGAGLVTDVDLQLERNFRPYLLDLVPGSQLMGEEEGGSEGEWTWWLDPLDGTTNFVHGWPRSAISLALYRDGQAHLGVVHDPYLQETFWAQRGEGAWCGQQRLQVSGCTQLSQALLCTGFAPEPASQWQSCRALQALSHGLRVSGCAALDLAYVACGRIDAFWEVDLKPWDVAAGLLLVREAGGEVSDLQGQPAALRSAHYLAANSGLIQQLRPHLPVL